MAVSTIKTTRVKYATITGTPTQYGSLLFNDELNSIKDRIVGIRSVQATGATVLVYMTDNFFGCFKVYPTPIAPYTSSITIKVAYI